LAEEVDVHQRGVEGVEVVNLGEAAGEVVEWVVHPREVQVVGR
jgi:hypothetical protein